MGCGDILGAGFIGIEEKECFNDGRRLEQLIASIEHQHTIIVHSENKNYDLKSLRKKLNKTFKTDSRIRLHKGL